MYFKAVSPPSIVKCDNEAFDDFGDQVSRCGGTITVEDLSAVKHVEFIFRAPPGKEIQLVTTSDGITSINEVELQLSLPSDVCNGYEAVEGSALTPPTILGSNVENIVAEYYDPNDSFVTFGKCDGCRGCDIFTSLKFPALFQGSISEIRWSAPVNPTIYAGATNATLCYDSDSYSWIRTPYEGAIVDAPNSDMGRRERDLQNEGDVAVIAPRQSTITIKDSSFSVSLLFSS